MMSGVFDEQKVQKGADQLDQKLVTRVQKGDKTAFDLLLVKYQSKVAAIVSRYTSSHEDIADLTQEIFIKAYRSIHSFRGDSAFFTWLYRIAVNHAKNHIKTKSFVMHSFDSSLSEDESFLQLESHDAPENILSRNEVVNSLQASLDSMPPEYSVPLILREFDGLSYQEIAKVMDCPLGTVRSRIFRAREHLDHILNLSETESEGA